MYSKKQIDRLEHGVEDEAPEKSEWELLNELDNVEYMRRTILPLLYPVK